MDGFLHDEASGDLFPIGYYEADDVPFYKGVAAEYTVCDRYHSGILASTQANRMYVHCGQTDRSNNAGGLLGVIPATDRKEHTSEPQSLMRISYAVFCLQKKNAHSSTLLSHTQQYHTIAT